MGALDPRLHAFRPDLADVSLEGLVTAARFSRGEPFHVVAALAPVRRAASADAMLLTQALHGEKVRVFETADGWAWGQLEADRYVGWLPIEALAEGVPAPTHRIAALSTFAFAAADIKTRPLATLPLGALVTVTGEAEDRNARYALVAPAGAVPVQHLSGLDAFETDWVAVAERFAGTPYLWGGKTSAGIDCSGLLQVALAAGGTAAPRDTDMQEAELGEPLAVDAGLPALRRGDLVFWKGHVGIMLDEDRLLHANAHHMAVATEPLADAVERIAARGGAVTGVRRLAPAALPLGAMAIDGRASA